MNARLLDTFDRRLRLQGVLSTRTGLHIGAGGSGDPLATDAPVVRNAAGHPFIPGSSLKGVVRSASESLLRGAEPREDASEKLETCDHISGEPCLRHDDLNRFKDRHGSDTREFAEAIWKDSCTVCRLFGSLAVASRVRFPDLPLIGVAPPLELRNGVGIDRDKELAASGVLYDFEAVPPETGFQLTVILDNYADWEAGLVLYLFEQLDLGNLALGGKTSRGLGQVRVHWQNIVETTVRKGNPFTDLLSTKDLLQRSKPESEPDEPEPQLAIPTSGDPEAWKTLAELVAEMPEIDKGQLGQKAAEKDFKKDELNDRLGLGLESKRQIRKAWDVVLERFVDCGFLTEKDGTYALTGEEPEESAPQEEAPAGRDPALQELYDRFIGAMAKKWETAF